MHRNKYNCIKKKNKIQKKKCYTCIGNELKTSGYIDAIVLSLVAISVIAVNT